MRHFLPPTKSKELLGEVRAEENIVHTVNEVTFGNQVMPKAKFMSYALDPAKDKNKALAFKTALGYTTDNADVLWIISQRR